MHREGVWGRIQSFHALWACHSPHVHQLEHWPFGLLSVYGGFISLVWMNKSLAIGDWAQPVASPVFLSEVGGGGKSWRYQSSNHVKSASMLRYLGAFQMSPFLKNSQARIFFQLLFLESVEGREWREREERSIVMREAYQLIASRTIQSVPGLNLQLRNLTCDWLFCAWAGALTTGHTGQGPNNTFSM